jgi:hypothetical protein
MNQEEINAAFIWPNADQITQEGSALYKHDPLLILFENLITQGKAWAPISGSTKRTEPNEKLIVWLSEQNSKKNSVLRGLGVKYQENIELNNFPFDEEKPAKRVITTSKNIAYIIDKADYFLECLRMAFGEKSYQSAKAIVSVNIGVFVYLTNSVESGGRAFSGDPFTGQAAAYSRIFAHDLLGKQVLNYVAYYPHQLFTQFFKRNGHMPENKGVKMLRSQADLIISYKGVIIEPKQWEVKSL